MTLSNSNKLVPEDDSVLYRGILAISNYPFHHYCKFWGYHISSTKMEYTYVSVLNYLSIWNLVTSIICWLLGWTVITHSVPSITAHYSKNHGINLLKKATATSRSSLVLPSEFSLYIWIVKRKKIDKFSS